MWYHAKLTECDFEAQLSTELDMVCSLGGALCHALQERWRPTEVQALVVVEFAEVRVEVDSRENVPLVNV